MGPTTLSQSIDDSDVGKSVGGENLFVSIPPPQLENSRMSLASIARLLGIIWVAGEEVERFWALESGRLELESRCHHLLLAL